MEEKVKTSQEVEAPEDLKESPKERRLNRRILLTAGFVFTVIVLLIIATYTKTKTAVVSTPPTPTTLPSSSPASDYSATWKTYSNQKYNFMFNYPDTWKLTETGQYGALGVTLTSPSNFQVEFGTNEQGFGGACNPNSFGYNSSTKIEFMNTNINAFSFGEIPNKISEVYFTNKSIPCNNIAYFIIPALKGISIENMKTSGGTSVHMEYADNRALGPESFYNSDGYLLGYQILNSFKAIKQ